MRWMTFEEFCQDPPKPKQQTEKKHETNSSSKTQDEYPHDYWKMLDPSATAEI